MVESTHDPDRRINNPSPPPADVQRRDPPPPQSPAHRLSPTASLPPPPCHPVPPPAQFTPPPSGSVTPTDTADSAITRSTIPTISTSTASSAPQPATLSLPNGSSPPLVRNGNPPLGPASPSRGSTSPATPPRTDIALPDFGGGACPTISSVSSDPPGYSSPECKSEDGYSTSPSSSSQSPRGYGSIGANTILSVEHLHEKPSTALEIIARARLRKRLAELAARNPLDGSVRRVAERTRDWAFGPITGHRVIVVSSVILCTAAIYLLQDLVWPKHGPNHGLRAVFADFSVLWLALVPPSVLGLVGALMYRHNDKLDEAKPIDNIVFWRIVSRGTNREALEATVERVRKEMHLTPLFPYVIEVATDVPPHLPSCDDLIEITVPSSYQPPNLSRFKARALHYALDASLAPRDAWLVHLDEETQPTSSAVKGIAAMIAEEEYTGELRIGQGALLYHRMWRTHPFLTLADNMRTGDDIARFYLQHCFGVTIFGLHGSYIVCRNDVEKSVGFDFGPVGSITEDAFWALVCMENGSRSRWVDGYLEEQSTQSVMDFIKQRRRWLHGLLLVCLHAPVKFQYRIGLMISAFIWAISPFATIYTVANFFVGASVNWVVRLLTNFSVAYYCMLYLIGAIANLDELAKHTRLQKVAWCVVQFSLMAVFSLVEGFAVVYAFVRPEKGFHVVSK